MFYHWLAPLGKTYIIFNLFNYISFRAAGATVTALLLAFVVGPPVIRRLRARKVGQVIRAEGPASHQSKRGTPTMGGLIILLATVVPTLLWAPLTNRFVVVAMLSILWMGCIGFLDDYLKIVQGKSRGLVAKWKLVGQVSFGLLLGLFLAYNPVVPSDTIPATATTLPFFKYLVVNFAPWLYVVFVTVVITGSSNAVNLTDGLDGLATGPGRHRGGRLRRVRLPLRAGRRDHAISTSSTCRARASWRSSARALMGATIGFLWFNAHPAAGLHGRHRQPRHRRRARHGRHPAQGRVPAAPDRRRVRRGGDLGADPDRRPTSGTSARGAGSTPTPIGSSGWRRCTTISRSWAGPRPRWSPGSTSSACSARWWHSPR